MTTSHPSEREPYPYHLTTNSKRPVLSPSSDACMDPCQGKRNERKRVRSKRPRSREISSAASASLSLSPRPPAKLRHATRRTPMVKPQTPDTYKTSTLANHSLLVGSTKRFAYIKLFRLRCCCCCCNVVSRSTTSMYKLITETDMMMSCSV